MGDEDRVEKADRVTLQWEAGPTGRQAGTGLEREAVGMLHSEAAHT